MKRVTSLLIALGFVAVLSGCALQVDGPANGVLLTNTQGPVTATAKESYSQSGEASAISVLGIVGVGNASINAAAQSAGIDRIHSVDQKYFSLLGIYSSTTTIVRGD